MSNNENNLFSLSNENEMSIINKNENDNNLNNSSFDTLNDFFLITSNKQNLILKKQINIPLKIQKEINEIKINNNNKKKKSKLYKLLANKNIFMNNNYKIQKNLSKSINKNFIKYKIKLENEKELKQFKLEFDSNKSPFGIKEFQNKFNKKYYGNRSLF